MKLSVIAALSPLLVGGCASTASLPSLSAGPGPEDPGTAIHAIYPSSVTAGYTARGPVEPGSWRKLNDDQASGHGGGS
jgi:hypothetical protein